MMCECASGYIVLRNTVKAGVSLAYACLCDVGRTRLTSCHGIETVLSGDALTELFGGQVPTPSDDNWRVKLQAAGVPPAWSGFTLDSYRLKFADDVVAQRYVEYAGVWARKPNGDRSDLILYGPNGTGKSGMAVSVARAALQARQRVKFWSVRDLSAAWRDLFRRRADGEQHPSEPDFMQALVDVDVLVLDEVTGEKMTEFIEQTITGVVDSRQKYCRPTILTLNIPKDTKGQDAAALTSLLGPTLMDRLRERGEFWPMVGASKRGRRKAS